MHPFTLIVSTLAGLLFTTSSQAQPEPLSLTDIAAGKHGLLVGVAETPEPSASTSEEKSLSLRPYPGMSTERLFWLFVPSGYDAAKPAPIVIVLHPRGQLRSFSIGQGAKPADLKRHALSSLESWEPIAEKEGFLVAFPIAEPDILHMGMSWQTRDRILVVRALLKEIADTHPYDTTRVYLVGSGEGGHAAICTAVRHGDEISAVAAANPPLFDGPTRGIRDAAKDIEIMMPETIPDMLDHKSKRRSPLLILAGTADKALKVHSHSVSNIPKLVRYQDTSAIPFDHMVAMVQILQDAKQPTELRKIAGNHYTPMPSDEPAKLWVWLKNYAIE